mgnify:CR=1 FL=1
MRIHGKCLEKCIRKFFLYGNVWRLTGFCIQLINVTIEWYYWNWMLIINTWTLVHICNSHFVKRKIHLWSRYVEITMWNLKYALDSNTYILSTREKTQKSDKYFHMNRIATINASWLSHSVYVSQSPSESWNSLFISRRI